MFFLSIFFIALAVINGLFTIHIFISNQHKGWIIALFAFPVVGALLYFTNEFLPRKASRIFGIFLLFLSIVFSFLFLIIFLSLIFQRGMQVISWRFFIESPRDHMTAGGIFPALVGSFYLTLIAMLIALPLGVLSAIFLAEYAKPPWLVKVIRIAINTLAGIPSIIYGLFGLAVFVVVLNFGISILAGGFTLAVLILPIIINASEEAIKVIPKDFREASLALGATKRETILKVVLPSALPSILTGAILSVGRAAGETAPIIFTAATFYTIGLPETIFEECMALPFHIYALMTEGVHKDLQQPIAFGTSIVLLSLVLIINLVAIIIRYQMRRNKKW